MHFLPILDVTETIGLEGEIFVVEDVEIGVAEEAIMKFLLSL